ncbi:polysaccharide deacetylase family protein [Paenibacillus flagellatus]|uniref:Polysaccharide deacetylase family protein n=1 Tax=Paenibacillus flagellatus TaxID=2211139 RepID=A0A2V5JYM9_9BACL|nr:polysaccharide deacetylase family protein [Paenibacillus flagellatus]PYI51392.1 polysaccharide deacetylase family protein [Paenibacillus flagellatus]
MKRLIAIAAAGCVLLTAGCGQRAPSADEGGGAGGPSSFAERAVPAPAPGEPTAGPDGAALPAPGGPAPLSADGRTSGTQPNAAAPVPTPAPAPAQSVPAPEPAKPNAKAEKPRQRGPAKPEPKAPAVSVQKSQSSAAKKLSLSELRAKYPEAFKVSGASKERNVALTFDDGPDDRFTPQVLDVLKAHGVKATFFLLGKRAEEHPDIVRRIVREGHAIGNHSYRHPQFPKLTVDQFAQEIEQTEEVLNRLTGYRPKLLRPPYGAIDEEQLQWAKSRGYMIVNWNVDSLDWKNLGEQQVSGNILGHAKAGSIVLQHSAGGDKQDLSGTVKALPGIIAKLREQGYGLVTVPELLHLSKSK